MQKNILKRLMKLLPVLILVLALTATGALATDTEFDTESFVGLVLQNTQPDTVTVKLYSGFSTASANLLTPVYTEETDSGVNYYYEVTAGSKYYCIAKPTSGYARYNDHRHFYITEEEAQVKTVVDVTPQTRSTSGWDPSPEIRYYTDETLTNIFPSRADLWPQYADCFTTPAFGEGRNQHMQTTQTEMEDFIAGLDDADDDMYVYILGQSDGKAFDIPLVLFTQVDLSGAETLEEAAALIKADGKLTVHYQAQIHGNEPAACEAALAMMQRLDGDYGDSLLDTMNIYVIPRLNPYGAYKSQRSVNNSIDPNRDFMKLRTTETQLRMQAYNLFDPEIVLDGHEFQVSATVSKVKKRDMMLCTHFLPTFTQEYQDLALDVAYAAFEQLEADGLGYSWYTDAVNGIGANTGSSNTAYRASLHILMETDGIYRGLQNYERRIVAHISTMTGIFAYLDENADTVKTTVQAQRDLIVENGKTYKEDDIVILDAEASDHEELHLTGQYVNLDSGTVLYNNSSFDAAVSDVINRSRPAPTAYVIPAGESYTDTVLALMDRHGITYSTIPAGASIWLQQYAVEYADGTATGNATLLNEVMTTFPGGAYVFTMDQVDGLILALLMEPDVDDLAAYSGTLVQQGIITAVDDLYPIYRYIRDLNTDGTVDYMELSDAPTGLTAVKVTVAGGTDGAITGLEAGKIYEYRSEGETEYTAVAAGVTEITGLAVGKYYVRLAQTEDAFASADTVVTVGYGVLAEYVVYLDSTNGADTNDGYTATAAMATIAAAQTQLDKLMADAPAGTTGKIVISGTYTVSGSQYLPSHDYPLLITGGKLVFTDSTTSKWLSLGGDTTFEDITIGVGTNSSTYFLYAEGHRLVIGENVVSQAKVSGSTSYYFNISGGGHVGTTVAQTDVTVKSGTWSTVYVGGYTGKVTGDAKAVLSDCSVSRVTPSYSGTTSGDLYMSLKNVTVRTELYCGNTNKNNMGGNVTLVLGEGVTSPKIYAGSRDAGNVTGTVTVVADGIDLTANTIHGKASNTTGTIGGLALVLNKGQLADVAEGFITRDGVKVTLGCEQTEAVTVPYSIDLDLNGCNASNVTVAEGKTVTACDTASDRNETLGVLSAAGTVVAAEGYEEKVVTGGKSYPKYRTVLVGDVDSDGDKDTDDAVYLLLHVMFGKDSYPVADGHQTDYDGSGATNTDDAVYLLLHVMFGSENYPLKI